MPKKRGKGNKLARMSDEERLRYLQHRAEIELEAKRRKQQLIAVFTKNKLKREEAFSRLNTAKINEQWRYILRQIKCKELLNDVEYLRNNFDKSIKAKDDITRRFYTELEIADKDHRRLQVAHMEMIDKLIGQHKQKLFCLHDFYMEKLSIVKSTDVTGLGRLKSGMEKSSKEMLSIISRESELWTDKVSARKTQCFVNIHNIIYIKDDMTSELVQNTSNELETLWAQLNEILNTYEMTTKAKRKQYEYLKEQDDAHKAETAEFPKIHLQMQDTIDCLTRNIDDLSAKGDKRVSQLKLTTKQMKEKTDHMKEQLSVAQTIQSAKLKKLSVWSSNALKHLEKLSDKGATITQFIKTCTKIEPLSIGIKDCRLRDSACEPSRSSDPRFLEVFNKLGNFWSQFNHIKADNVLFKKELNELSEENRKLKQTLRTYLIGVSGGLVTRPIIRELSDAGIIRCH